MMQVQASDRGRDREQQPELRARYTTLMAVLQDRVRARGPGYLASRFRAADRDGRGSLAAKDFAAVLAGLSAELGLGGRAAAGTGAMDEQVGRGDGGGWWDVGAGRLGELCSMGRGSYGFMRPLVVSYRAATCGDLQSPQRSFVSVFAMQPSDDCIPSLALRFQVAQLALSELLGAQEVATESSRVRYGDFVNAVRYGSLPWRGPSHSRCAAGRATQLCAHSDLYG